MSAESVRLLAATWSWWDAVLGVVILGGLAPLMFAIVVGSVLLGLQRRDWRLLPGAIGMLALVLSIGVFVVLVAQPPAPPHDYLFALSASIGLVVLIGALTAVGRQAVGRRRRDRTAAGVAEVEVDLLAEPTVAQPAVHFRVNAVMAEHLVAEWMQHLGAIDSVVTPFRRDGGVDVRSARYVAQVKNRSDLVPVDQVRALVGVASAERRQPLFFTSGSYSRDAIAFAGTAGVALFIFRAKEGRLVGANRLGAQLKQFGLGGPTTPPSTAPSTTSIPTGVALANKS